jgi:glucose-1-phosphate cytidylyltransferase
MKTYATQGHKDFILCLGYKGDMIKEYFRNYHWSTCDLTVTLGDVPKAEFHNENGEGDWKVTLAETGEDSMTAYRIRLIEKYLGGDDTFLLTYGDGVGNIDINAAIAQHRQCGHVCTLTAVHPPGRFGELSMAEACTIQSFNEKPQTENGFINGGYMVCSRKLFEYLPDDPSVMLEQSPLKSLAAEGKLGAYIHNGFWQPMDTYQEYSLLNRLWSANSAPWRIW